MKVKARDFDKKFDEGADARSILMCREARPSKADIVNVLIFGGFDIVFGVASGLFMGKR